MRKCKEGVKEGKGKKEWREKGRFMSGLRARSYRARTLTIYVYIVTFVAAEL